MKTCKNFSTSVTVFQMISDGHMVDAWFSTLIAGEKFYSQWKHQPIFFAACFCSGSSLIVLVPPVGCFCFTLMVVSTTEDEVLCRISPHFSINWKIFENLPSLQKYGQLIAVESFVTLAEFSTCSNLVIMRSK